MISDFLRLSVVEVLTNLIAIIEYVFLFLSIIIQPKISVLVVPSLFECHEERTQKKFLGF